MKWFENYGKNHCDENRIEKRAKNKKNDKECSRKESQKIIKLRFPVIHFISCRF